LELEAVTEVLELTATAGAEVGTERYDPLWRCAMNLDGVSEDVSAVNLGHPGGYLLPGQCSEDEDHQAGHAANPHAPVPDLGTLDPDHITHPNLGSGW
jgi:hypothetical protein